MLRRGTRSGIHEGIHQQSEGHLITGNRNVKLWPTPISLCANECAYALACTSALTAVADCSACIPDLSFKIGAHHVFAQMYVGDSICIPSWWQTFACKRACLQLLCATHVCMHLRHVLSCSLADTTSCMQSNEEYGSNTAPANRI